MTRLESTIHTREINGQDRKEKPVVLHLMRQKRYLRQEMVRHYFSQNAQEILFDFNEEYETLIEEYFFFD